MMSDKIADCGMAYYSPVVWLGLAIKTAVHCNNDDDDRFKQIHTHFLDAMTNHSVSKQHILNVLQLLTDDELQRIHDSYLVTF